MLVVIGNRHPLLMQLETYLAGNMLMCFQELGFQSLRTKEDMELYSTVW